jgi:hypothetical protein
VRYQLGILQVLHILHFSISYKSYISYIRRKRKDKVRAFLSAKNSFSPSRFSVLPPSIPILFSWVIGYSKVLACTRYSRYHSYRSYRSYRSYYYRIITVITIITWDGK